MGGGDFFTPFWTIFGTFGTTNLEDGGFESGKLVSPPFQCISENLQKFGRNRPKIADFRWGDFFTPFLPYFPGVPGVPHVQLDISRVASPSFWAGMNSSSKDPIKIG